MSKTRHANWDYAPRDNRPAPYNAKCPICGHDCYIGHGPTEVFYSCPVCGMVTQETINIFSKRVVAIGRMAPGVDVMVADPAFARCICLEIIGDNGTCPVHGPGFDPHEAVTQDDLEREAEERRHDAR